MRVPEKNNPSFHRLLSPRFALFVLAVVAASLATPALKAQTMQFANEGFVLSDKEADLEKTENDYLLNGETESNWSQKLVLTRFPTAKDANAFAENLCAAINTQRPGTGATVSRFGADCYIAYSVASSVGTGQLNMVHRILIDPQGGIRSYVFAQRPSASKSAANQTPIGRDQCIQALGRLSPMIQLAHN
jgi:hypothetical protein